MNQRSGEIVPDFAGNENASQCAENLRQLAAFHITHGTIQVAERLTCIALWLDRKNPQSWRLRANCLARLNKPREALKLLSQARSEGITGLGLKDLMVIGMAFARGGQIEEAQKFLKSDG